MIYYINHSVLKKFSDKTALLRIDLNATPSGNKEIFRLEAVLPTIKMLIKGGVRVVILSHRGRPKKADSKLSLKPFVPILSKKLSERVSFVGDFKIPDRSRVLLLENLRFHKGERDNNPKFAEKISSLGDFYINDGFAVSHHKNASFTHITKYLPSYGGLLLKKEIEALDSVLKKPRKPFVIIIGGIKIGDKLSILNFLHRRTDSFLLGSGPAATFLAAEDLPVGESFVDDDSIPKIKKFIGSKKVILPLDLSVKDKQILDIGRETIRHYSKVISEARTIIWSGPVGLFEKKEFAEGTKSIWRAILKSKEAKTVVGGGETLESLYLVRRSVSSLPKNVFLSTGGGAMLEYLSGQKLPGLEALKK